MSSRVIVVGGGIAGLTAAFRLATAGGSDGGDDSPIDITVLEAASRFGGKIRTERFDGYVVETGPDSFLTSKPWALELTRDLDIDGELQPTRRLKHRARIRGPHGLRPLPPGLSGLVPSGATALLRSGLLSLPGRLRAAVEPLVPRRRSGTDESIASFVRRRFGRETYDWFMEPLLAGIHGGRGEALSLAATFPALAEAERQAGSVMRGLRATRDPGPGGATISAFVAPRAGMQRLIEALLARLSGVRLVTDAPVRAVHQSATGWSVDTDGAGAFEGDAVIVAVPANAASPVLASVSSDLSAALARIPFASTIVVQTAFESSAPTRPLDSAGYLNPARTGRPVSACTWVSAKFDGRAPRGTVLLRTVPRIESHEAYDAMSDARAVALALDELEDTLGIRTAPLWYRVYRYPNAMPQYTIGHRDRVRDIRGLLEARPGLVLAGHSYDGVGIPDAVRSAGEAAAAVATWLRWASRTAGAG